MTLSTLHSGVRAFKKKYNMDITELLKQEPYLTTTADRLYLIPQGLFGYTAFPVGTVNTNGVFVPAGKAVTVTPDQYIGLKNHTYCWNNNELIPYIKPIAVAEAEETIIAYNALNAKENEAREYLKNHDYISSKVANAVLMNDAELLAQYREEYKDTLIKLTEARNTVNQVTEQRAYLKDTYEAAIEIVNNHH